MKLKLAILSAFAISASANPKVTLGVGGGYAMAKSTLKIDGSKAKKAAAPNDESTESGHGGAAGAFLEVGYEKSGIEFGLSGGADLLFAKSEHKFENDVTFNSGTGYLFGLGGYVGGSPINKLSLKAGALVTFLKSGLYTGKDDQDGYKIPVSIGVMPFARVSYAITSKISGFLGFGWNFGLSKYETEVKPATGANGGIASAKPDTDAAEKQKLNADGVNEVKFGSAILVTAGVSFKLM